jgi:hypothetical protein
MPRGSPAVKLAISVDRDVHAQVLRAAKADSQSVSAWLTQAARRALALRAGLAAVAEWESEHGPLTSLELDEARARVSARPGRLLAKSRTADVVDASVVAIAVTRAATIVTSDPDDLELLVAAAGGRLDLVTL